ncbi:MAG: hypothetical protein PW792_16855 [Acidobacteriaceae bacterium]|nr:hypothetical protein [Acidobacteriaceae bacterium]
MHRLVAAVCFLASTLTLTGCGVVQSDPTAVTTAEIHGLVHGGQQPIAGAHVYLMKVATSGYGAAATSILTSGDGSNSTRDAAEPADGTYVNTSTYGAFSLTGHYQCSTGDFLYVLATGGNPGLPGTVNNAAIAEVAPLGLCENISSSTFVSVTEVSTAAMAYTLHGFMSGPLQVSAPVSAAAHLKTGLAVYNAIVNNGAAVSSSGHGGSFSQKTLNTVGNALAVCVNTTGPTSTTCSNLLTNYATSTGATGGTNAPDTTTAAWNIANHPAASFAAIVDSQTSTPPFVPFLATNTPRTNLALTITYTAPAFYSYQVCVDANDNVWYGMATTVDAYTPTGATLSGGAGFTVLGMNKASQCRISPVNGNVVFSDGNGIDILSSTGTSIGQYSNAAQPGPVTGTSSLAITSTGDIWEVGHYQDQIGVYSASGASITDGSTAPVSNQGPNLATNSTNQIVAQDNYGYLTLFNSSTKAQAASYNIPAAAAAEPAVDSADNIFIPYNGGDAVLKYSKTGAPLSGSTGYTGAGIGAPQYVSVDGAGNVWITGLGNPTSTAALSAITNSGIAITPVGGYPLEDSKGDEISNVVDGAGNVWVFLSGPGDAIEYIGAATPVYVPLIPTKLGVRP